MKYLLSSDGYRLDDKTDVWSRPGYSSINYSDGETTELRIAKAIGDAIDVSVFSTELRQHCIDWPSTYHLSATRSNLLRPLSGSLTGDVLEIGAGCGAITRYLGECGGTVLALEGSLRRAGIARSRTRDLPNVTVLAEQFEDFKTTARFDVVTLIGVLEYANLFARGNNPHVSMLQRVRSLLKPNGRLIIAIENQLGLKYFAGALEDHLGKAMYGVEGRYQSDQPQTFGKRALTDLLAQAGLSITDLLCPFPDYKLPVSIVTKNGIDEPAFDAGVFAWQSVTRDPQLPSAPTFCLESTWPQIFNNGLTEDLTNSFLMVAAIADTPILDRNVLAFHYSSERIAPYCKETVFRRSDANSISLSRNLTGRNFHIHPNPVGFECRAQDTYISGKPLSWEFVNIVTRDGWTIEEVAHFIQRYVKILHLLDGANQDEGSCAQLSGRLFDAAPHNIVIRKTDGEPVLIDSEWTLPGYISIKSLLFRSLLLLIGSISVCGRNSENKPYSRRKFIKDVLSTSGYPIADGECDNYIRAEAELQHHITGRPVRDFLDWKPDHLLAYKCEPLDEARYRQQIAELDSTISILKSVVDHRDRDILTLQHAIKDKDQHVADLTGEFNVLLTSRSWRITRPLRRAQSLVTRMRQIIVFVRAVTVRRGFWQSIGRAVTVLRSQGLSGVKARICGLRGSIAMIRDENGIFVDRNDYQAWIQRYDTITDEIREDLTSVLAKMEYQPKISVVMPVFDPPIAFLDEAIWSVRRQIYTNWELCIADDASKDPKVKETLRRHADEDERIKVVFRTENGHISKASNSALEVASGEFIALLDNDDLLPEYALFYVAQAIQEHPDAAIIYSDEDKLDSKGIRTDPYFKCDWNPELFLGHNLISHFGVYRATHVKAIGGFRVGYEGSQDYDLAARIIEVIDPRQIIHIPHILYHWRMLPGSASMGTSEKPYALLASEKALNEHLERRNVHGKVEALPIGMHRIRYSLPEVHPLVSIIIPTKNAKKLVHTCISTLYQITAYRNFEVILIDNGSEDKSAVDLFSELSEQYENLQVIRDDHPFNFSALNNQAARYAHGEFLLFLNNDTEIIHPEWLSEMVSVAIQEKVGAVGAKLIYRDGRVQHAGVLLGLGPDRVAGHMHHEVPRHFFGYFSRAILTQEVSAVTAACMLVKKKLYDYLGGFDERLGIAFNDVDLCLRLRQAGYRNIWTPHALLYHHESLSRGSDKSDTKRARLASEAEYMRERWGSLLMNDPAYNPNLTLEYGDFSLAWPPRTNHR